MAVCNPSCVSAALPTFGSLDCNPLEALRSGEIPYLGLIKCSSTFTDVLDAAEWTAKKAAGEIVILPVGSGSIGEKSITQTRRINCQNLASACEQAAEFTSAIVDNVTFAEWDKYNIIEKAGLYLLPFFITCDNKIIISSNYTTGGNIGISKKTLNISQILSGEEDAVMEYKVTMTLNECSLHRVIDATPALIAAILA